MVSKKIRLGIVFQNIDNWQGGFNYYCSLISSLKYIKNKKKFEYIIFSSKKYFYFFKSLKIAKKNIYYSSVFDKISLLKIFDKFFEKIINRNLVLEKIFKQKKINLISHFFKKNLQLQTIPWIPDLQHKYLKNLFPESEIIKRDEIINDYLNNCRHVIVSSEDTKKSLQNFYHAKHNRIHVLNFVPELNFNDIQKSSLNVITKFKISENFIYVANQFWVHKNHELLIRTASILKKKNKYYQFVLSGNYRDYRNKKHFEKLIYLINLYKVKNYFKFLGNVSRKDLINLIYHSKLLINPSIFEGWSTIVEEAKILNKKILVSDIKVHQEQSNKCCVLFLNNCEFDLYKKIILHFKKSPRIKLSNLHKRYISKRKKFSETYLKILRNYEI